VDLVSCLSPTLWDLLQRTRLRSDLALELFDEALIPLLPSSEDLRCAAVRRAASIRFYAGTEVSFRTVLQSGREARLSVEEWDVTLLPIRDGREPVGLLAAITQRPIEGSASEWVNPGPGEAAARAWRDAIEGDLVSTRRLRSQEQLTHRSRALASFVADLQQFTEEEDLLSALLQAIAVWHDVEPCAYARDLAGNFILRATLPGTDVSALPPSLEAGAVIEATAGHAGEWPVLTQLGWRGKGTPLLILVSSGSLEEWLVALTGPHETDINEQLQPMLRGFSMGMERVREREARRLRQELWNAMIGWAEPGDLSGLGRGLLGIIARAVDATHGVLTVANEAEAAAAAGALVRSDGETPRLVRDGYFTADTLGMSFPLGGGRIASMELRRTDRGAFRSSNVTALLAVRPLLGAWFSALRETGEWEASFAAQDQPRVLRFNDTSTSAWS
jgi:hypothetical protein